MADAPEQGIGLADAIEMLRAELLTARVAAAGSKVQFPVGSMTVELKVAATRSADGKAGFSVPFVNVGLGGSMGWERETMQTVTVTFGSPVDEAGNPVNVSASSDELMG
jgi:Trypsin-co-occurring domain 2